MGNRSKQLPESIVQCRDCLAAMIRYCDRDDLEWSWSWCATVRCSGVTPGLATTTVRKLLAADNQENPAIIYGWVLAQLWIIFHAFHLFQEAPTTTSIDVHLYILLWPTCPHVWEGEDRPRHKDPGHQAASPAGQGVHVCNISISSALWCGVQQFLQ